MKIKKVFLLCLSILLLIFVFLCFCNAEYLQGQEKKGKEVNKTEILLKRVDYLELQLIDKEALQIQLQSLNIQQRFEEVKRKFDAKIKEFRKKYKIPVGWEFDKQMGDKFLEPKKGK